MTVQTFGGGVLKQFALSLFLVFVLSLPLLADVSVLKPEMNLNPGESLTWGDPSWTDLRLETTLEFKTPGQGVEFFFRMQDVDFGYSLLLSPENALLYQYNGSLEHPNLLQRRRDLNLDPSQPVHLVVSISEFDMEILLNGNRIISRTDRNETYPSGFLTVKSHGAKVLFSDFSLAVATDETMESVIPGYFPKGDPRGGGVRDMMLIYNNTNTVWASIDALPYVAYIETDPYEPLPTIKDWFFDTFLFLALLSRDGRAFDSPNRATPAIMEDWQWFLEHLFRPNRQLAAFERAIEMTKDALGTDEDYKAKVIFMIPNPMAQINHFGTIDGQRISFSPHGRTAEEVTAHRWAAVKWYMDLALEMWEEANFQHLEFLGFYWVEEMIHYSVPGEAVLVRQTADYIHDLGLYFYWIPWFNAQGHKDWEALGFDLVIHQPNYMFRDNIPTSRFAETAAYAKLYHQGIEIEADERILTSPAARERFRDYLRASVTYGYNQAAHGYYQGSKIFYHAALSHDPAVRSLYDDLYKFVKGEWTEGL